ncbi:MAG: Ig-like domain-containing protein [Nocardioides sp.]
MTVTFTGVLPNGGCDGDYIRIPVPPELRGFTGTFPVNASDGTTIATMVVTGTEVLMTFNSYLESHSDVRFSGFVLTQVRSTVVP